MNFQHSIVNGIYVATAEMPHMESVSAGIYLPTGSRYESAELNGIAHFAEHMIFKGTQTRSALDLAIQVEGAGGSINAFTTEDQTCVETRGPSELLPQFVEVMSDMVWNSSFEPEEVEREREVIAEEIVMYQENPSDHIHDLLSEALWSGHPLGRPITGTEESIQEINADALREFTQHHYLANAHGLTLAVAGKVTHAEVCEIAKKNLPVIAEKTEANDDFEKYSHTLTEPNNFVHLHDQRDIDQVHLAIAFHTDGRHSDHRHVLRVMSLIMGETMSSRLFQELREKRGLCYHIASDYSLYHDTGTFEIHAGLDATRLEESLLAINEILQEILKNGFTKDELDQTICFASGQSKIALESTHSRMSWMGDSLLCFDKIIDPNESRATLQSTTLEELSDLAKQLFNTENMAVASIGPQRADEVQQLVLDSLTF
ncbi:MAG: M16 family metallopeptidase [Akkermansiaceae bacterium]